MRRAKRTTVSVGPEQDKEKREQGQPPQKQREAPEELRYEAEKLADNDLGDKAASWQTQYQREKIEVSEGTDSCRGPNEGEPIGVAADTQEEPTRRRRAGTGGSFPPLGVNYFEPSVSQDPREIFDLNGNFSVTGYSRGLFPQT